MLELMLARSPHLQASCAGYGLDFSLEKLPDGTRKLGADLLFVEDLIESKKVNPGDPVMLILIFDSFEFRLQ